MALDFSLISAVTQTAGLLTSAAGSYYSAKSQKSSLNYQAQMSALNARLYELSAQSALSAGKVEAAQTGLQYGALKSRQRASMAARGIDLGVGSAAETQASTELLKDIDLNTIKANAMRQAFGIRSQGINAQNESLMASASASGISPGSSMASTLLGGAGQVAASWYQYSQTSPTNSPMVYIEQPR
ncbi:MAG: hypothetical protein LBJ59_12220 [Zoogloeaceae bacterium]|jgi:hypothetical protein|nr:hypothetical protein [Zoogloeaceae bacterium]